jgi:hypothetical protein
MAAVKSAPLRKIERARATAAYEHDEEAAPSPVAVAIDCGESSGKSLVISLETTACTVPERAKPKISAQRIYQIIPNARERALSRLVAMLSTILGLISWRVGYVQSSSVLSLS